MGDLTVAWMTHARLFTGSPAGGAEMADEDMIRDAPVKVGVVGPDDPIDSYDRVVVAGAQHIPVERIPQLTDAVVWAHGSQAAFGHMLPLYEQARAFIALTPRHLAWEQAWIHRRDGWHLNPGTLSTAGLDPARTKDIPALWAHRDVPHKGLQAAEEWAARHGVPLTVATGRPRSEVLDLMSRAERFVLLSSIPDGGPRAVIEAQLAGCELVVNDNVGYWDEPADDLRRRIDRAADDFWELVCE